MAIYRRLGKKEHPERIVPLQRMGLGPDRVAAIGDLFPEHADLCNREVLLTPAQFAPRGHGNFEIFLVVTSGGVLPIILQWTEQPHNKDLAQDVNSGKADKSL